MARNRSPWHVGQPPPLQGITPHTEPRKTMHRSIIIPARRYSTRNRRRHTTLKRALWLALVLILASLFWGGVLLSVILKY